MSRIFISYSRRDREMVDSIVEKIEAAGIGIWIDREDIKAGKTWRVQIVEAIATCDAFVLMLSSNSAASDNVRREIDLAQDAGRAIFIMRLDPVKLPAEMLYQLVGLQHIELQQFGREKAVHRLIDTLDEHLTTWKPDDDRTVRQVELVLQGGARAEFGAEKRAETLGLISALTETPQSQLGIANLAAGGVHVFVDMPAAAAFELKTRALNRDRRIQQFGIKSLRVVGDKQYVNTSLGILTPTATIGTLNMLWMHLHSLFTSLFGVAVGKVIVPTTVVVVTTVVGIALTDGLRQNLGPVQTAIFAQNPSEFTISAPIPSGQITGSTSTPAASSEPTSTSSPTISPTSTPLPTWTIAPAPSPTKTLASISFTLVPSPTATWTKIVTPLAVPIIPTATPSPTATNTPSETPTPTSTPSPTDTLTPQIAVMGQNLIHNSSFEDDPNTNETLWFADTLNTDLLANWSVETARTGSHALFLSATRPGQQGWPGWFTANTIPIADGYTYTFGSWAFTPDGAGAWLEVYLLDDNGSFLMGFSTGCYPSTVLNSWQFTSVSFSNNDVPGASQVRLGLQQCLTFTEGQVTSLFYDDIFFGVSVP